MPVAYPNSHDGHLIGTVNSVFDVLVAGGSLAGLYAAALFSATNARVALVTSESITAVAEGDFDVRNYAINVSSQRALNASGAWGRLDEARLGRFEAIEVWDENSCGEVKFARPAGHLDAMGWIVEDTQLRAALWRAVGDAGVEVIIGQISGLHSTSPICVELSDGRRLEAALGIAADGANSTLRDAAGIEFKRHSYQQRAIVANVAHSKPHSRIARQRFLATGPLAFLPMAPAQLSSIVWSCDEALAAELERLDDAQFKRRLGEAFEHRLGDINGISERREFSLESAEVNRWHDGALVVVGDAAHVVHPLAGQGLNLGLMDVAALHDCIADRPATHEIEAALERYHRWRSSEAMGLKLLTDGLHRLFSIPGRPLSSLRGLGMKATDRAPFITARLAALAMGAAGDLPSAARISLSDA